MIDNQHVGHESCQNSVDESYDMKGVGNCGPSEREDDEHEVDIFGSSSRSEEIPVSSDDWWHSLEISDESALDGEVGKRLNQMVPIPVSVALLYPLASILKSLYSIFCYDFQFHYQLPFEI